MGNYKKPSGVRACVCVCARAHAFRCAQGCPTQPVLVYTFLCTNIELHQLEGKGVLCACAMVRCLLERGIRTVCNHCAPADCCR